MREEKKLLLDEIKNQLSNSNALIFTRYSSLTPDRSNQLRRMLAETDGAYFVVPKRVFIKAATAVGIELDRENFQGNIGIVFAYKEAISSAKVVFKFAKEHADTLEVLAGQFEGKLCSAADVKAVSELPSTDEMRSQLLGLFEAPMAQTLSALEALLTSVIYCLDNKAKESK